MSSLIIEVCQIDNVEPHKNADRMAVATIKGWRTCIKRDPATGKTQFQKGDKVIYFPPDSILPETLADDLGVTKYLTPVRNDGGQVVGHRVRVSRLRGEPSYGLVMEADQRSAVGYDVAAELGIKKWEPPLDATDGDAEKDAPAFHKYFTLENYLNFPNLIGEGEEVVFTEKLHGKNCRVGLIREPDETGTMSWVYAAGSHDVRRKPMCQQRKRRTNPETGEEEFYHIERPSQFWEVFDKYPHVKEMLQGISHHEHNVIVFGEIYGSGVQDMAYGLTNGNWGFRVFDIAVDGLYLSHHEKAIHCTTYDVERVPELYRGPFSKAKVEEYVSGPTTMCDPADAGKFKEREGIVITTVMERTGNTAKKFFDRAALKAINFKYLERKEGTEHH